MTETTTRPTFITPEALLEHWQGHRRLTRRVIEAFPGDRLFTFAPAPPMRPFGALALEVIHMVKPTLTGLASGRWESPDWEKIAQEPATKDAVLELWDHTTEALNAGWAKLSESTFLETHTAFGQWTMPGHDQILYLVDNEIHHRGQGYVYLRLLGLEPPAFYER